MQPAVFQFIKRFLQSIGDQWRKIKHLMQPKQSASHGVTKAPSQHSNQIAAKSNFDIQPIKPVGITGWELKSYRTMSGQPTATGEGVTRMDLFNLMYEAADDPAPEPKEFQIQQMKSIGKSEKLYFEGAAFFQMFIKAIVLFIQLTSVYFHLITLRNVLRVKRENAHEILLPKFQKNNNIKEKEKNMNRLPSYFTIEHWSLCALSKLFSIRVDV